MKKAIKISLKLVSILSAIVILIASFSLFSFADTGKVFTIPLNQPTFSDCQGYIEYVVESPDYQFTPVVLLWRSNSINDSFDPSSVSIYYSVNSVRSLTLFVSSDTSIPFTFTYFVVYGDGTTNFYSKEIIPSDNSIVINLASGYKFYGFKPYGCYESFTYPSSYYPSMEFSFIYSQNGPSYELLLDFYELLSDLANNLVDLGIDSPVLEDIYSILEDIKVNTGSTGLIARRLLNLHNVLVSIEGDVDGLESYLDEVEPLLSDILNQLNSGSDIPPPEKVDKSDINDYGDAEEDLIGGQAGAAADSALDTALSSDPFSPNNKSAIAFIWDILQRFWDGNSKVFGLYFSIMSFGVVSLLLGR